MALTSLAEEPIELPSKWHRVNHDRIVSVQVKDADFQWVRLFWSDGQAARGMTVSA